MKKITVTFMFCASLIGCQKNGALEENVGICNAYHASVKNDSAEVASQLQPVVMKTDVNLVLSYGSKWIEDLHYAQSESDREKLISRARKSCRAINVAD